MAGDQAVIKPWPLLPAVEGGFTADDFTVDAAAGTVTCPAGITRRITAKNAVIFGAACRDCPLRDRCTTSKSGRTLHLHEHDALLRAARAAWAAGTGLREDYMAHRPHVERAIAQAATWRGRRLSSATAERPGTTPGSSAAPPLSTCATCSAAAWPAATAPGSWPPDRAGRPALGARAGHQPRWRNPGVPGGNRTRNGRLEAVSTARRRLPRNRPNSAGS